MPEQGLNLYPYYLDGRRHGHVWAKNEHHAVTAVRRRHGVKVAYAHEDEVHATTWTPEELDCRMPDTAAGR